MEKGSCVRLFRGCLNEECGRFRDRPTRFLSEIKKMEVSERMLENLRECPYILKLWKGC